MTTTKTLVGVGEILWDLLPAGKQLGGAPANFAYHAHSLGGDGVVASAVGNDDLGEEILQRLDQLGLSTNHVTRDESHSTGTVGVELDEGGHPRYDIHENVAWDHLTFSDDWRNLANSCDAVCFGSLAQRSPNSRETIQRFVAAVPERSLKIFDVNLRQSHYSPEVIRASLELANVFKVNDDELPIVCDQLDIPFDGQDAAAKRLIERNDLRLLALTKGSEGADLHSPGRISRRPAHPAKVVDSVGAGDSFTAAMALGLLFGLDLDDINDRASEVAAFVCSSHGATPTLPARLRFANEPSH